MVRAAIPHIGVLPHCVRLVCHRCGTLRGRIATTAVFRHPATMPDKRQEWKYTGTRRSRQTHRFAFDGSDGCAMHPRGRVAHYRGVFHQWRDARYVVPFSVLSLLVRGSRIMSVIPHYEIASDGTDVQRLRRLRIHSVRRAGLRVRSCAARRRSRRSPPGLNQLRTHRSSIVRWHRKVRSMTGSTS